MPGIPSFTFAIHPQYCKENGVSFEDYDIDTMIFEALKMSSWDPYEAAKMLQERKLQQQQQQLVRPQSL